MEGSSQIFGAKSEVENDELPSREGAPGGLDRASGFPFPL